MTKYGVISNMGYTLASVWRADKALLLWVLAGTIVRVLFPFAGIVTPRIVIDEIVAGVTPGRFLTVMAVLGVVLIVIYFINGSVGLYIDEHSRTVAGADFTIRHSRKLLTMDYANREQPDFITLNNKTTISMHSDEGAVHFVRNLSGIAVNIGGLMLFGGIIAMVHPLIIVLLCVSVAINGLLQRRHRKFDEARREYVGLLWQKVWHVRWAFGHKPHAQDIRMYSMTDWLMGRWRHHLGELRESNVQSARKGLLSGIIDSLMVLVRDGGAYAFLTYLLLADRIGLGEFVMLFAAIGGMAAWINGILTNGTELIRSSVNVSDRRETLEYPDVSNDAVSGAIPDLEKIPEIRLENVSYTYPNADKPTLKNISLTIHPGERLAVVGVNGAGKTTLIKLICGFYRPDEGEVFYNGTEIRKYSRDDFFTAITAVFQQIYLLADNVAVNVAQSIEPDTERVRKCLIQAGLWEKVKSLDNGLETKLVREVDEDAIRLSGGEQQKLALARALYKDAPLIILDEPTAALDPIAESEMYQQYATLTTGKTSVYISHRLASTRFCDRIILLDGNVIAEEGTHDELMAKGGKYAEMFATQASYYNEGSASKTPAAPPGVNPGYASSLRCGVKSEEKGEDNRA